MSKYGSSSLAVLLVDGYNLLSSAIQSIAAKVEAMTQPTQSFGDAFEEHTPTGLCRATLALNDAFFDDTTASLHDAMVASTGVSRAICVGFEGNTIGKHAELYAGAYTISYEPASAMGGLTKANVVHTVNGQVDHGAVVHSLAAKTADWDTTATPVDFTVDTAQQVIPITSSSVANPTVITCPVNHGLTSGDKVLIAGHTSVSPDINGTQTVTVTGLKTFTVPVNVTDDGVGGTLVRVDSAGGGVGILQVTAASGFTNFVGKIQHSADNITYTDLITFADNVVAPFAEVKTVTGTVNRYLAFSGNVTGSGSITVFCAFARR